MKHHQNGLDLVMNDRYIGCRKSSRYCPLQRHAVLPGSTYVLCLPWKSVDVKGWGRRQEERLATRPPAFKMTSNDCLHPPSREKVWMTQERKAIGFNNKVV